jgi:P4 family phage/plasmid primase-like protien
MTDRYEKALSKLQELSFIERVGSTCDVIIVGVLYELLVGELVHYDKEWWYFEGGTWQKDGGEYLWTTISETFVCFLRDEIPNDDIPVNDIVRYLGSSSTIVRLMKALSYKLGDPRFSDKLNSQVGLIGMKNGTYDIKSKSFRRALSSDYISLSCGIKYIKKCKDKDVVAFMRILRQIFPRKDVLDFFIRSCASMLEGYNKYKVFYVWWGKGNNAKTLMQRFIASILGDYSACLSTSLITGKRANSSDATPDIHYAKNKLAVFLQEPNPEEKIQVGRIKELTGNDKIYSRGLFKSGESMEFKAKIVVVANNALEVPGMDVPFRRRIVVIPFESTFTNSKDNGEYVFPEDVEMEEKIFKYREIFMAMILDEYSMFIEEGLSIPQYIKDKTSEYITLNNYVLKFIRTKLYHSPGTHFHASDLYDDFKDWFRKSCPGRNIPLFTSFSTELRNEGYEEVDGDVKNVWCNA